MAQIKNKKIKFFGALILTTAIFSLSFFIFHQTAVGSDCSLLTGDAKNKCQDLEDKAQAYQDIIDLKNKQQTTLQNQMDLINKEQSQNQLTIQQAHKLSQDLDSQINDLEQQLSTNEDLANYQKKILANLMQSYYENSQQEVTNIILVNKNFSDIFNQQDYAQQSSSRIQEMLQNIQDTEQTLQTQQDNLNQKKQEAEDTKTEMLNRNNELAASENQKNALLATTQGEEAKYQQLLQRVEQQKLELFDFSSASNLADVSASVDSYAKPDSKYWASTGWYFSQQDSRWGNKTIGNSHTLMKDYGCAVTALAMVFRHYGASIDPGVMAKQKIFSYDLIQWPGAWSPSISLASSVSHGNINWKTVDAALKAGHLVIVFIQKTNGRGGHYVVIHNKDSHDYVVHDPYFGPNLYLGTSRALVGKLGADSGTTVNQMIIYD